MNERSALLDACVLIPSLLCDLLLRIAEEGFYVPMWSERILDEIGRSQVRVGFPEEYARRWRDAVDRAFPDAPVKDYDVHIDACMNHPKDRHVLAAAIKEAVPLIVTFNLRDFPRDALEPWSVRAIHPSDFLGSFRQASPEAVEGILFAMAKRRSVPLSELLTQMRKVVPEFVAQIVRELSLHLD